MFIWLKEAYKDYLFYRVYADDMVFVLNANKLPTFLKKFQEGCQFYNLIINPQKCGIFDLGKEKQLGKLISKKKINREKDLLNIPIVVDYKYLGVTINHNGSIAPHIKRISDDRALYLQRKMHFYV